MRLSHTRLSYRRLSRRMLFCRGLSYWKLSTRQSSECVLDDIIVF